MAMECRLKSHEELDDWMRDRRETNETLAMKVHRITKKKVSVATIAHLRRGARTYCTPERARAIEEALSVKKGDLFVRRVIGGSEAVRRSA